MRPLTVGNKQPLLAFCEENNLSWLLTARTFGSANNAKKATPPLLSVSWGNMNSHVSKLRHGES